MVFLSSLFDPPCLVNWPLVCLVSVMKLPASSSAHHQNLHCFSDYPSPHFVSNKVTSFRAGSPLEKNIWTMALELGMGTVVQFCMITLLFDLPLLVWNLHPTCELDEGWLAFWGCHSLGQHLCSIDGNWVLKKQKVPDPLSALSWK